MQETIIALSFLWIWFGLRQQIELEINTQRVPVFLKWVYYKTDFKPLNCEFCLTIWTAVCLSIGYNDLIYLSLPIIYKLIRTYERR